jgi:anti-sigma B factor antagonist
LIDSIEERDGVTVIRLSGRLDAAAAPEIKQKLLDEVEGGRINILLNLQALSFIDSSGLGVLVSCLRRVTALGGDLRVACVPELTRSIFELTRLSRVFELDDDEEAALSKLRRQV